MAGGGKLGLDVFIVGPETDMPKVEYEEECRLWGICWMECPKWAIDLTYSASLW